MAEVTKTMDVNVPVQTAYNQWTQFETFPEFMEGVEEVRQLEDDRLQWRAAIAGKTEEWEAKIDEQIPDQRIAWHSTSGAENAGVVTFHRLDDQSTRVALQMSYEPRGVVENVGDMLGVLSRRVEGDLGRFKQFIEERRTETGEWRGEIRRAS